MNDNITKEILLKENNKLKNVISLYEKRFQRIWELGFDYDGYSDEKNLKKLIDELVSIAEGKQDNLLKEAINELEDLNK